jgi:hypothetical protein
MYTVTIKVSESILKFAAHDLYALQEEVTIFAMKQQLCIVCVMNPNTASARQMIQKLAFVSKQQDK